MSENNGDSREYRKELLAIRTWTARENKIVMLDLLGELSNTEIGEAVGLKAARVGQILKDPRALEVKEAFRQRSKEIIVRTVEEKLDRLAEKSVERLDVTLDAELIATSRAKPNQDKVALSILKGRHFLGSPGALGGGGPLFSKEGEKQFLDMMEKANSVREINPFSDPEEYLEAEVIEDEG